jgi:hypothetical protein
MVTLLGAFSLSILKSTDPYLTESIGGVVIESLVQDEKKRKTKTEENTNLIIKSTPNRNKCISILIKN